MIIRLDQSLIETLSQLGKYFSGNDRQRLTACIDSIYDEIRSTLKEQEASAYDFAWQLTHKHRVNIDTYSRAADAFGHKGLVDIVMLIGLYMTTCSIINAFEVSIPKTSLDK
jgi:hypothetical protein